MAKTRPVYQCLSRQGTLYADLPTILAAVEMVVGNEDRSSALVCFGHSLVMLQNIQLLQQFVFTYFDSTQFESNLSFTFGRVVRQWLAVNFRLV